MKLYVGNLPFTVKQEDLEKAFAEFGKVEDASLIIDKFTNRSKGFGFVTFENDEDAKKAISAMNEKDFQGRNIKVTEAKPKEEGDRPRRSFGGQNRGGFGGGNRGGFGGGNRGGSSGGRSFGSNRDGGNRGGSSGNRDSRPKRY